MDSAQFIQLLQDNKVEVDAYVAALPAWVQYWMHFMSVVFVPSFLFAIKYHEARVIAVALAYSMVMTKFILLLTGPTLLWGLAHILFWLPALIYVLTRYKQVEWKTVYGAWLGLACFTLAVSLIFDFRDVYLYFA